MDTIALGIGFVLGAAVVFVFDTFTVVKFQLARHREKKFRSASIKLENLDQAGIDNLILTMYEAWEHQQRHKESE